MQTLRLLQKQPIKVETGKSKLRGWFSMDRLVGILPRPLARQWLDARASRITDPIEKLKFLRHVSVANRRSTRMLKHAGLVAITAAVVTFVPVSSIMRATGLIPQTVPPPKVAPIRVPSPSPVAKVWMVDKKAD